MKKKHHSRRLSVDPDFLEVLCGEGPGDSSDRQAQRKTQQLCRQVQRALNTALDAAADLPPLFVEEVVPAPDCGRLLVRVLMPADASVADVLTALAKEKPRLRSEVAAAITRKRAPELHFVPAQDEGGCDE